MQLFNGIFPVAYGQFYFFTESDWDGGFETCFLGQSNGLCGVMGEGGTLFITGLHTGNITLTVNSYDNEPEIDDFKDEIVEASFSVGSYGLSLEAWGGKFRQELNLPIGDYRIRYSAKNFGRAEDEGEYEQGNIELYNIDIWPSDPKKDKIIKATSEGANYWHDELGGN